jgi:hypothetical protein
MDQNDAMKQMIAAIIGGRVKRNDRVQVDSIISQIEGKVSKESIVKFREEVRGKSHITGKELRRILPLIMV